MSRVSRIPREELIERALRFIAVQQIAETKLTADLQTVEDIISGNREMNSPSQATISASWSLRMAR
jgi:hypothetical protein